MGVCFSAAKVISGDSNPSNSHAKSDGNQKKIPGKHKFTARVTNRRCQKRNQQQRSNYHEQQRLTEKKKTNNGRNHGGGAIPLGKRVDFGYAKDFESRYTVGKLLGHGQFGYTYVAMDKENGARVAVKRIDRNKVALLLLPLLPFDFDDFYN